MAACSVLQHARCSRRPAQLPRGHVRASMRPVSAGPRQQHMLALALLLLMLLAARHQALSPDKKVLLDFKESQRKNCPGYDEAFFSSWSDSGYWYGVTFAENGAVSELLASSMSLCGPLPSAWSSLVGLSGLELSNSGINGTLPSAWSSLVSLSYLYLSGNNLSGTLPSAWSSLVSLDTLSMFSNSLNGTLPSTWSSLAGLYSLDLTNTSLSGTLPSSWSSLDNLYDLILPNNSLNGTLPSTWSSLAGLYSLDLSSNSLSGTLPSTWSSLDSLFKLALSNNSFNGTLPSAWSTLNSLKTLDLSYNGLNGTLPGAWSSLVGLSFLLLPNNSLSSTLPSAWSSLHSMYYFRLSGNSLNGTLPSAWRLLNSLFLLDLSDNSLSGTLPSSWSSLATLSIYDSLELDLSGNSLNGTLPSAWSSLDRLKSLNLNNNSLNGTLPSAWSSFVVLYSLDLSDNSLDGTLPSTWSSFVDRLTHLDLSNNSLSGTLPSAWSSLIVLASLDLSANSLNGTLPSTWSSLVDLGILTLSSNPFTPQQVPEEWIDTFWSQLVVLDMSDMGVTGPLPVIPEHVEFLNMSHNSLTGSITGIPGNVAYLNLAGNKLTGSIPSVNSSNLVYLDIANNGLTKLPSLLFAPRIIFFSAANNSLSGSILNYTNHSLAYCDLSNNRFTGTIPQSWTTHDWGFLSLHNNKLSGPLHKIWEGSASILLLQNNSIHGCLPESWLHNDSMAILSLSHNKLTCELPSWYANNTFFQNLQGIYLDGNDFAGLIPVDWMNGFSNSSSDKTIVYLGGAMWHHSSDLSQQRSVLPTFGKNNWRKSVCLSDDLNARLDGLSNAVIPTNVVQQLQSQLDAAMDPARRTLKERGFTLSLTIQLPSAVLRLSNGTQASADQICTNDNATTIVTIQWGLVAFLLALMLALYMADTRFGLPSRRGPKSAVLSLHLIERIPLLASLGVVMLRLVGILFYWFDVGTDIFLLVQVFAGNSSWAPWVLLTIMLLHYIIGAALLGWYFAANQRYLLVLCVLLLPVMPLVDTAAALMTAVQKAGKNSFVALQVLDWHAVFELRHALEFLLESVPMAVLQTVIFMVGNKPGVGVYLDDWTYILAAAGTCFQILGMAGLVLYRAATEKKMPFRVLCSLLTLPKRITDTETGQDVVNGMDAL